LKLRVLYFASLKDRAGTSGEEVEMPPGTDVDGLWTILAQRHPRLAELAMRPATACDMSFAQGNRSLDGVTEVAFLPPMSGG